MSLPYEKSWNDKCNISHYARVETILNLEKCNTDVSIMIII